MKKNIKKHIASALTIVLFGLYVAFQHTTVNTPIKAGASSVVATKQVTKTINSLATTITKSTSGYKNGTYTGSSVDAYYGTVQVSATISNGRLSDIALLSYPQDRSASLQRSNYALPILKSEAISSQNANVNTVSSVTYTSEAFISSLSSALAQATA